MVSAQQTYDVLGLGFGPSNLAIAGALLEKSTAAGDISLDKVLFIERYDEFKWHPGMLLPDARMQISFLKDLATLRSPQSPITFIAYLKSQNRLIDFINKGTTIPTRKEYADYLAWAADYVQSRGVNVAFGEDVVAINEDSSGTIEVHSTKLSTGEHIIRRCRNIVISPGGYARFPQAISGARSHPFVIHSSAYLHRVGSLLDGVRQQKGDGNPLRIAVVGGGQSAAEVLLDLHSRLSSKPGQERHQLDMIIRTGSLKPSDDSPFTNEIFNPDRTDMVFGFADMGTRRIVRSEYHNTNYSVVNPRTIDTLYDVIYDQKLDEDVARRKGRPNASPHPQLTIRTYSNILSADTLSSAEHSEGGLAVIIQNVLSGDIHETTYDAIVCATGYERRSWAKLLTSSNVGKRFGIDSTLHDSIRLKSEAEQHDGQPSITTNNVAEKLALKMLEGGLTRSGDQDTDSSSPTSTSASSDLPSPAFCSLPPDESRYEKTLYISRGYRLLLPRDAEAIADGASPFKGRIYLQGCEEETHGLSDTLLSVVGVRAGEVVDDLYAA
ncbi:hypothetical protein CONPUDRAFT_79827 [Coniophora puteana RWD-64-598 SS2]|uniref:L-ornithine N(5)-monooxygenase [NAD(P)H] n=1 Tax=Coniophora puteana (strain RWD-64-598) TaxID=741705 RepID=A0A5M3N2J7_CONPW|nr:uncharacterized protein CONPUDRAFT_79827 [Coniophora puteana RWD-64-598 SS2]EIW85131.1 hypothetical protein CONPUDRAFT_79827 [Coniophora puteana RWD-64-598 SS2]